MACKWSVIIVDGKVVLEIAHFGKFGAAIFVLAYEELFAPICVPIRPKDSVVFRMTKHLINWFPFIARRCPPKEVLVH